MTKSEIAYGLTKVLIETKHIPDHSSICLTADDVILAFNAIYNGIGDNDTSEDLDEPESLEKPDILKIPFGN